jgi:cell division transport system permease protein
MARIVFRRQPRYLPTILGVALILLLVGLLSLIVLYGQQLVQVLREQVSVLVELGERATEADMQTLKNHLQEQGFVKPGTLTFVSKEEALESLRKDFGEDFFKLDLMNPLFHTYQFNVRSDWMQPDKLERIRAELKEEFACIEEVHYQEFWADLLSRNVQKLFWGSIIALVVLMSLAFFLIHHTIRLALYAQRFLIRNMELVGASWGFISRPFLLRSLLHGLLSGVLAVAGLYGILLILWRQMPGMESLHNPTQLAGLFALLLLMATAVSVGSTYYVVNKYLKMRVDDLYEQ